MKMGFARQGTGGRVQGTVYRVQGTGNRFHVAAYHISVTAYSEAESRFQGTKRRGAETCHKQEFEQTLISRPKVQHVKPKSHSFV
ncbi:MAG: hypothetical protein EAZ89_05980 [Bacteroidetes bacterium]|nr:MAG: hypothetical protein EAZ89_05980 [Bacteroidota bacterium]